MRATTHLNLQFSLWKGAYIAFERKSGDERSLLCSHQTVAIVRSSSTISFGTMNLLLSTS